MSDTRFVVLWAIQTVYFLAIMLTLRVVIKKISERGTK